MSIINVHMEKEGMKNTKDTKDTKCMKDGKNMKNKKERKDDANDANILSDNFARIDSILNPDDGKLPFGYYSPEMDGKVTWNCGTDQKGDIISVFCYNDNGSKDKKIAVLPNMKDAIYARDELIKAGWLKIKPPEITVKHGDSKKPLSRKEKRYLQKNLAKMDKENPFDNDG